MALQYVASFSSELPSHPASNLLQRGSVGWKGKGGEGKHIVVLQLARAMQIGAVDVGNNGTAYLEIQVARVSAASTGPEVYETLLPMTNLMTPQQCRDWSATQSVLMLDKFVAKTAADKWDRIKLICTQNYNKTEPFGLTFVQVTEGKPVAPAQAPAAPSAQPRLGIFKMRSVSDASTPVNGSLFFANRAASGAAAGPTITLGAASTPSLGPTGSVAAAPSSIASAPSNPAPMRRVLPAFLTASAGAGNSASSTASKALAPAPAAPAPAKRPIPAALSKPAVAPAPTVKAAPVQPSPPPPPPPPPPAKSSAAPKKRKAKQQDSDDDDSDDNDDNDELAFSDSSENKKPSKDTARRAAKRRKVEPRPQSNVAFHAILKGVTFVLSGFENPYRNTLRTKALDMGALYMPAWGAGCTHLVCAFADTPKYNEVKGKGGIIVKEEWVNDQHAKRRQLDIGKYLFGAKTSVPDWDDDDDDDDDSNHGDAWGGGGQTFGDDDEDDAWEPSDDDADFEGRAPKKVSAAKPAAVAVKDAGKCTATGPPQPAAVKALPSLQNRAATTPAGDAMPAKSARSKPTDPGTDVDSDDEDITAELLRIAAKANQPPVTNAAKNPPPVAITVGDSDTDDAAAPESVPVAAPRAKTPVDADVFDASTDDGSVKGDAHNAPPAVVSSSGPLDAAAAVHAGDGDVHWPPLSNFFEGRDNRQDTNIAKYVRRRVVAYGGSVAEYRDADTTHVLSSAKWDAEFDSAAQEAPTLQFLKPSWVYECVMQRRCVSALRHTIKK